MKDDLNRNSSGDLGKNVPSSSGAGGLPISNDNESMDPPSAPLLLVNQAVIGIPYSPSTGSFRLSDAVSIFSGDEIAQRREALRLFSSQLSMTSSLTRSVSRIPPVTISYDMTPFSSTLSSLSPSCRICQCPNDVNNVLITPCRCDGSLKHIHGTCLRKWIEVSQKKHKYNGPPFCELCGYIYRKHTFFKCRDWKWPKIASKDKALHLVFAVAFVLMVACAIATVLCFTTDREELIKYKKQEGNEHKLTKEEVITICCGVTFFLSFFVAMSAELKAKHGLHQIARRCIKHNTVWMIENYNTAYDHELKLSSGKTPIGRS